MNDYLEAILSASEMGRPIMLRGRLIRSGWKRTRLYPHFFITINRSIADDLGWKPGTRLVPFWSKELGCLILIPARTELL